MIQLSSGSSCECGDDWSEFQCSYQPRPAAVRREPSRYVGSGAERAKLQSAVGSPAPSPAATSDSPSFGHQRPGLAPHRTTPQHCHFLSPSTLPPATRVVQRSSTPPLLHQPPPTYLHIPQQRQCLRLTRPRMTCDKLSFLSVSATGEILKYRKNENYNLHWGLWVNCSTCNLLRIKLSIELKDHYVGCLIDLLCLSSFTTSIHQTK